MKKWGLIFFSFIFLNMCSNKPYTPLPENHETLSGDKPGQTPVVLSSIEGKLTQKISTEGNVYLIYSPSRKNYYYLNNPSEEMLKLIGDKLFTFEGNIIETTQTGPIAVNDVPISSMRNSITVTNITQREPIRYFGQIYTARDGLYSFNYKIGDKKYLQILFTDTGFVKDCKSSNSCKVTAQLAYKDKGWSQIFTINNPVFEGSDYFVVLLTINDTYTRKDLITSNQLTNPSRYYYTWDADTQKYIKKIIPDDIFSQLISQRYGLYLGEFQGTCQPDATGNTEGKERRKYGCKKISQYEPNSNYLIIKDTENLLNNKILINRTPQEYRFSQVLRIIVKPNSLTYYQSTKPTYFEISNQKINQSLPDYTALLALYGVPVDLVSIEDIDVLEGVDYVF